MTPDRIKEVFLKAVELPSHERTAFVLDECGPGCDPVEVEEILSLVRAHETSTTFLQATAMADAGLAPDPLTTFAENGSRLGPFVIESVIGTGGMGVVFRARQESPPRPVALKVMRAVSTSGAVTRRFKREAAALARLHHPAIAQVYSAGVEERDGRQIPYLAMELVDGLALDQYLRSRAPGIRERTELLARVCEGVAHAHQRGVVHRDLKPANITVDPLGHPKILDFGIARLVDREGTDPIVHATSHTQRGEILGTLAYMSPEQFEGDPSKIDVRSDVYALGVILYEVLAGRPAISTENLSIAQAALAVSTREAPPLGSLNPSLRGDLETIAAKALEKDPVRRYQSAAELSEDLRRFLRDEPILARPATTFYRTSKFVRRNRVVVLLGLCVFSALVAGLLATMWQARQTRREALRASEEAQSTNEINQFLSEILLAAEPDKARGRAVTVRMAVDDAAAKLDRGAITSHRVLASLYGTLARSYDAMGEFLTAERYIRRAIDYRREVYGDSSVEYFDGVADLCISLRNQGKNEEAASISKPALERCRLVLGNTDRITARLLNAYANSVPNSDATRAMYEEALRIDTQLYGPEGLETLSTFNNLAAWYLEKGHPEEGLKLNEKILEIRKRTVGADHPDTIVTMRNMGVCYRAMGRIPEAVPILREALEVGDRVRGQGHPQQLAIRIEYGLCLGLSGKVEEADRIIQVGIPLSLNPDGTPTEHTPILYGLLGEVQVVEKKFDLAEQSAQRAMNAAIAFYGADHVEVKHAMSVFVSVYEAQAQWAKVREWNDKTKGSHWYQERYALKEGEDPSSPPPEPLPPSPTPPTPSSGPPPSSPQAPSGSPPATSRPTDGPSPGGPGRAAPPGAVSLLSCTGVDWPSEQARALPTWA